VHMTTKKLNGADILSQHTLLYPSTVSLLGEPGIQPKIDILEDQV
jgi:hypothetical protein